MRSLREKFSLELCMGWDICCVTEIKVLPYPFLRRSHYVRPNATFAMWLLSSSSSKYKYRTQIGRIFTRPNLVSSFRRVFFIRVFLFCSAHFRSFTLDTQQSTNSSAVGNVTLKIKHIYSAGNETMKLRFGDELQRWKTHRSDVNDESSFLCR